MSSKFLVGLGFCVAMQLGGCATDEGAQPAPSDPNFPGIDPDQKALPIEGADLPDAKPVTDVTLDGTGEKISNGTEAVNRESTPAAQDVMTASEAPPSAGELIGSGPEKRFIKAWDLNIRSQPNRFSKIVGRLKGGDEVHVTIRGGWAKLDEGRWIRSRWLVKSRPDKFVGAPDEKVTVPPKKKAKRVKKNKAPRKRRD